MISFLQSLDLGQVALSVMSYLAGAFTTYWLSIHRDRSKAYAELVAPIRARLIESRGALAPSGVKGLTAAEIDRLGAHLNWYGMRKLQSRIREYERQRDKQAAQRHPGTGWSDIVFKDPGAVTAALDRVIAALPHR